MTAIMSILQKLVHVSDLHFLPERNAFCQLDKHGDIEEVIRIMDLTEGEDVSGGTVVTIKRDVLDNYMALTDSVAVVMFDFTRFRPGSFNGWPHRESDADVAKSEAFPISSLKLIEECLIALYFEEDHAQKITSPLHEIHNLRSKLKGHASDSTATSIRRKVLAEHKTLRQHFYELCKAADESLRTIIEAFKDTRFAK